MGILWKSRSGLCSARPTPDGAVLVIRGGILAVGLIGEYGVVGDSVGTGAGNLALEETPKTTVASDLGFLLVVGVEEIELAGAVREVPGDALEQAAHDSFAKRVE